jgi:hypothetical protein
MRLQDGFTIRGPLRPVFTAASEFVGLRGSPANHDNIIIRELPSRSFRAIFIKVTTPCSLGSSILIGSCGQRASGSPKTRSTMAERTMNAVVFKGPHKVALEKRPVPKIKDQTDIIVKVIYSALCGRSAALQHFHVQSMNADDGCSELHVFRVCLLILVEELIVTIKNNRATRQARLISSWGRFSSNSVAERLILCSHEFTGTVEEVGSEVKNFKKGDQIVSPFTVSWYVFSFGT